jgi:predicted alpha-1,6-mannanase (GH76 family)
MVSALYTIDATDRTRLGVRRWWLVVMLAAGALGGCSSSNVDISDAGGATDLAQSAVGHGDLAAQPTPGDGGVGADLAAPDPAIELMHQRADSALSTLMLNFWPQLAANTTVFDWSYAHYWDALVDAGERRGPNAYSGTVLMFYQLQDKRGWTDDYYDDENWITLALLHSYSLTNDSMYLEKAKFVFADIMKGWDTTCCGAHPGGIYWHKPNDSKVTAINAGAVISASRLYAATQDQTYLDFAKKTYAYWSTYMVDQTTGHVYDGISTAGVVNTTWTFTYNEGLFIGAILALHAVTNDDTLLPLAHKVAGFMMASEMEKVSFGSILSDGKCGGDGQMFKGVGARYLEQLYQLDPTHTEYRDFLARSGTAAWTLARDPATGDISCDWMGPFDSATGGVQSLGSASVGLAAAAKALGAGAQRPALTYEAEEGNLHGVGLEAIHGSFSGWGYLAGWGSDGQSVDILVDVPKAGAYKAELRYATGDAASRAISVNGASAIGNLAFPSTGGYDTYGTVTPALTLAAGRNTITVALSTAAGSGGYLNLDRLQLTAN